MLKHNFEKTLLSVVKYHKQHYLYVPFYLYASRMHLMRLDFSS